MTLESERDSPRNLQSSANYTLDQKQCLLEYYCFVEVFLHRNLKPLPDRFVAGIALEGLANFAATA